MSEPETNQEELNSFSVKGVLHLVAQNLLNKTAEEKAKKRDEWLETLMLNAGWELDPTFDDLFDLIQDESKWYNVPFGVQLKAHITKCVKQLDAERLGKALQGFIHA